MRFFPAVLLLVALAYAQSQLIVPQLNNLNALESLRPQIKNFLTKLDQILPQLAAIITKPEIHTLKDKIVQVVLGNLGKRLDINSIKDLLRPVLQQYLAPKLGSRFNFDAILQNIAESTVQALPSIVMSILGKRDVTESRLQLNDVLSLADKLQLTNYIPQISQLLSSDKLQSLYNQLMSTGVLGLMNQWNANTMGQAVQQLITQFIPQLSQSRLDIDWEKLGGQILQGAASALPGILIGLLGKRDVSDARLDLSSIASIADKLQLANYIPQISQLLSSDKLQSLYNQLMSTGVLGLMNQWNANTMGQAVQQLITQFIPQLSQSRLDIDWEKLGGQILQGAASALPGILIGLLGKRDLSSEFQQLLGSLSVQNLGEIVQIIRSGDRASAFSKIRKLLEKVFPGLSGRFNFDDMANNLINHVNNLLTPLSQSVMTSIVG